MLKVIWYWRVTGGIPRDRSVISSVNKAAMISELRAENAPVPLNCYFKLNKRLLGSLSVKKGRPFHTVMNVNVALKDEVKRPRWPRYGCETESVM